MWISTVLLGVKVIDLDFFVCFFLSFQFDSVGLWYDAIKDSIRYCRFVQIFMPFCDGEL